MKQDTSMPNQNIILTTKEQLQNGVGLPNVEDYHKFGILDYYELWNMTPFELIKRYSNMFTPEEIRKLKSLHRRYFYDLVYSQMTLLNMNMTLMVMDELHEVTLEDKLFALDYMENHHIPFTMPIYNTLLRSIIEQRVSRNQKTIR